MNFEKLIGDEARFSIEHRILNIILLLGIAVAPLSAICNYFMELNRIMMLVCLFCMVSFVILYYISRVKKREFLARSILVFMAIFLFIPVLWIFNGGLIGGTAFYILILSSMIAALLRGVSRIATLGSLVVMSFALIIIEYQNPAFIYYSDVQRYLDTSFSLMVTLIINVIFSVVILNYYIREQKKARHYYEQIEQQNIEKKMARLDRLNLIGEMAASLGHEVRNPMTTVRGYLQLFQRNKDFTQYGDRFEIMIAELDRASEIITEFLSLAKDKLINVKLDNINRTIKIIYPLLQADALLVGKSLTIELGTIPDLFFDSNEIRQCILNLVRNSLDATDNEGIVIIRTYTDGEMVVLEVQDNGTGIPPEVYAKLGTPFVTTKSQGTGLGIPVCFRIAERHHAHIEVETSPQGTIFSIRFKINNTFS